MNKPGADQPSAERELEIPIAEETVRIRKLDVETGEVRIDIHTQTDTQVIEELLRSERVAVERVPINAFVEAAPATRREGDTLIIPCVEEVAVVVKRLRLREEIHITTLHEESREEFRVDVRRQHAEVTRESNEPAASDSGAPLGDSSGERS